MTDKDWTKQLREKMESHQASVPEGLWEDIAKDLPTQPAFKRALWPSLRRYAAAAAILAFIGGTAYLLNPSQHETERMEASAKMDGESPSNELWKEDMSVNPTDHADATPESTEVPSENAPVAPTKLLAMATHETTKQQTTESEKTSTPKEEQTIPGTPAEEETLPSEESKYNKPSVQQPQEGTEKEPQHAGKDTYSIREEEQQILQALEHEEQKSHSRHSRAGEFGLFAANNVSSLDGGMTNSYDNSSARATRGQFENNSFHAMASYLNGNQAEIEEHIKHHRPYSIGLSYRYPLTSHLALQTGLVYTRLQTDFDTQGSLSNIHSEQVLHYVGIPLHLAWTFLQRDYFGLYLLGGTEADFNVKATSNGRDMDKDRMQWSGLMGIGGQANLTPHVAFYAEPSLRYYLDNGSNINNYYKDHPLKVALHFGLRITP